MGNQNGSNWEHIRERSVVYVTLLFLFCDTAGRWVLVIIRLTAMLDGQTRTYFMRCFEAYEQPMVSSPVYRKLAVYRGREVGIE